MENGEPVTRIRSGPGKLAYYYPRYVKAVVRPSLCGGKPHIIVALVFKFLKQRLHVHCPRNRISHKPSSLQSVAPLHFDNRSTNFFHHPIIRLSFPTTTTTTMKTNWHPDLPSTAASGYHQAVPEQKALQERKRSRSTSTSTATPTITNSSASAPPPSLQQEQEQWQRYHPENNENHLPVDHSADLQATLRGSKRAKSSR
jgi:hypothetical protein